MSFNYEPMTNEECERERQFPMLEPGVYDFQVREAKSKISSSGNDMIAMILTVWDKQGKEFNVYDYLVGTKKMGWKTKHFCDSVGLSKEYEERKFTDILCIGKSGKASIIYQPGQKKADGGYYKDKNAVEDYIMTNNVATNGSIKSVPASEQTFDDDIPF